MLKLPRLPSSGSFISGILRLTTPCPFPFFLRSVVIMGSMPAQSHRLMLFLAFYHDVSISRPFYQNVGQLLEGSCTYFYFFFQLKLATIFPNGLRVSVVSIHNDRVPGSGELSLVLVSGLCSGISSESLVQRKSHYSPWDVVGDRVSTGTMPCLLVCPSPPYDTC